MSSSAKSLAGQAQRELKNIISWYHEIEELKSVEIFEADKLWLQEVVSEVKSLVCGTKKCPPSITEEEEGQLQPLQENVEGLQKNGNENEEDDEEDDEEKEVPVLLPKTPNVRKKKIGLKRKSEEDESDSNNESNKVFKSRNRCFTQHLSPPESSDHVTATTLEEPPDEEMESQIDAKPVPLEKMQNEDSDVEMKEEVSKHEEFKMPTLVVKPVSDESDEDKSDGRHSVRSLRSKTSSESSKSSRKQSLSDHSMEQESAVGTPKSHVKNNTGSKSSPLHIPCDSTFVLSSEPNTPARRRSSRLSNGEKVLEMPTTPKDKKELSAAYSSRSVSKENHVPNRNESPSPRRSVRLNKQQSPPTNEVLLESKTFKKERESRSQYKGLVSKALRTSVSADSKRHQIKEDTKSEDTHGLNTQYSTPMSQTRKILRAFSATSSSGMKSVFPRSQSAIRHRSPVPSKVTSTFARSSRVFLSSKSASKLVPRTGGSSNIVRGLTSLLPQKPPKPTAEEIRIKSEEEARRKRCKEEEAIKRKEEIARLKIEEKKNQREARLKKVMENKKMLKKQPSTTDLRKHEINTKNTKQPEDKKAKELAREREEKEKERARLLEIHMMQKQKEKLLEAQRVAESEAKAREEAKQAAKEPKIKPPNPMLNITVTKDVPPSSNSYDMTPAPEDLPPEPLEDENNYDVGDLKSDDDTDDEDQPRKVIPKWATGPALRQAIMLQTRHPPNISDIFDFPPMPNLDIIFPLKKRRFFKRTSSAVWNKAPIYQ